MRRIVLGLLVLSLTSVMADRAHSGGTSIVGVLNEVNGSGVSGRVSMRPGRTGGTRISVSVKGLEYNVEYVAVYANNAVCDLESNSMSRVLQRFRGTRRGAASLTVDVTEPIDRIHSVSVRLGDGLGLVSCAPLN